MSKLTTKLIMLAATCGLLVAGFGTAAIASHVDMEPVITKTYSPQPAIAGEPVTFTLTATNEGRLPATNIVVMDIAEGNPTLVSATATLADGTVQNDACYYNTDPTVAAEGFYCPELGPLAAGETITIHLTVVYPEAGTFQNEASIGGLWTPPPGSPPPTFDPSRNVHTISVEVMPPAPTTKAQCKKGGYAEFGFASQKECMAFVRARA